jgi:hypothetical protein
MTINDVCRELVRRLPEAIEADPRTLELVVRFQLPSGDDRFFAIPKPLGPVDHGEMDELVQQASCLIAADTYLHSKS